jgi:DNA (cytosine-5)-methyltransferase 1
MNENRYTHVDLFSGIGGFALAARWCGIKTIAFCECEPYAQKVLQKHWPDVPIYPDVRTFPSEKYAGAFILTGGFPCQPFSCAGKRGGAADDRFLWPEMVRVIAEARPAWIIGENVRGIVTMELDRVLSDLERIGYTCWPVIIPACAVDAKHRRDRVWIVANTDHGCLRQRGIQEYGQNKSTMGKRTPDNLEQSSQDVADTQARGTSGYVTDRKSVRQTSCGRRSDNNCTEKRFCTWQDENDWFSQSGMGRLAYGVSDRVAKLKGLGNAIVPQVAAELMRMILKTEE